MSQVKLINSTKHKSIVGQLVRIDPLNSKNYILADFNSILCIGTIAEVRSPGGLTKINLINTVSWEDVMAKPTPTPKITISSTPPINPQTGDLWIEIGET